MKIAKKKKKKKKKEKISTKKGRKIKTLFSGMQLFSSQN